MKWWRWAAELLLCDWRVEFPSFSSHHLFLSQEQSSHSCVAVQLQHALPVLCAASHTHTLTHTSLWFNVWSKIWVCGFDGAVRGAPGDDGFSPKFECTDVSWLLNTICWWGMSLFLQEGRGWKTEQLKGMSNTKRSWHFCGPYYSRS